MTVSMLIKNTINSCYNLNSNILKI
jgi:hypothetical protein